MILVKQSFAMMDEIDGEEILKLIESAGRTCYKSEDKITFDSSKEFVKKILKRGHESVIEHRIISVRIVCDRGVSHEIVRHRIGSYSQESTRYCDYSNGHITFIIPCWSPLVEGLYESCDNYRVDGADSSESRLWFDTMISIEKNYKQLRLGGWKPEQARSVLPNSLKTEIVCTYNLREWRHFFNLRCAKTAHPQMREITIPLLKEFYRLIPIIFDDLCEKFIVGK